MHYENMIAGQFCSRPNRFIANVLIAGREETVHVKNTGRCRELLPPGAKVYCQRSDNPGRKTAFDLIAVEKAGRLINMDSQAPNKAVQEWLIFGGFGEISELKPESVYGDSRLDFAFRRDGKPYLMEVKGVTLETEGVCAFPDAPTERGRKHLGELTKAVQAGYGAAVLFVIQMEDVQYLQPNDATDPAFGAALREAKAAGVEVLAYDCRVSVDTMELGRPVPVRL